MASVSVEGVVSIPVGFLGEQVVRAHKLAAGS